MSPVVELVCGKWIGATVCIILKEKKKRKKKEILQDYVIMYKSASLMSGSVAYVIPSIVGLSLSASGSGQRVGRKGRQWACVKLLKLSVSEPS